MSAKPPTDLQLKSIKLHIENPNKIIPQVTQNNNFIETTEEIVEMLDSRFIEILNSDAIGLDFSQLRGCKNWYDLNIDTYDIIEMIILIEKKWEVNIYDSAADGFERFSPDIIWQKITKKKRDSKLNDLGI